MGVLEDLAALPADSVRLEIENLQNAIEACKRTIATTQTTLSNQRFFDCSVADYEKKIALFTRQLADLRRARDDGPQIIADAREQMQDCAQRLQLLRKHERVRELLKLRDELNVS